MAPLPERCRVDEVHSDQGIFGHRGLRAACLLGPRFWPVWDRRRNYWLLFAAEGLPVLSDVRAELLQLAVKPFIDRRGMFSIHLWALGQGGEQQQPGGRGLAAASRRVAASAGD